MNLFPSARTIEVCPPPVQAHTLAHVLRLRAYTQPDDPAFAFLGFGSEEDLSLNYRQLERRVNAIVEHLRLSNVHKGDRVLLLYPSARDFVEAFFACLYIGAVAVPAVLPFDGKEQRRLLSIAKSAQPVALLCRHCDESLIRSYLESQRLDALLCISTTELSPIDTSVDLDEIHADDLAFLQYTSGSTALPKGVMVSHRNLLDNLELIAKQTGTRSGRCMMLSWLPHFHDMGLIGTLLQPIYIGRPIVLMPVISFLQQPMRWLRLISELKVTHSAAPNFAYDLCLKYAKRSSNSTLVLDLSEWRSAFSGAEPIRYHTLKCFSEHFAANGFRLDSFAPGYGLAEATLMVTAKRIESPVCVRQVDHPTLIMGRCQPSDEEERSVTLVSCGNINESSLRIHICNPDNGELLAHGQVGEICLQGESVCRGYFGQPGVSAETFNAFVDKFGTQGILRTGDLGFVDENGELFITGRLKDIVICHGVNHYPQDLELLIERVDERARAGRGAVFNILVDQDAGVFAVYEVSNCNGPKEAWKEQADMFIEAIRQGSGISLAGVALIAKGEVPKTSSGKIQRRECRQRYLEGSLTVLYEKVLSPWDTRIQQIRKGGVTALTPDVVVA